MIQGGGKLFVGSGGRVDRSRAFRPARPRRRRAEILAALRSRSRSRRRERARHSAVAVEGRLAGGRRQLQGGHIRNRIGAHRNRARTGGQGMPVGGAAEARWAARPRGARRADGGPPGGRIRRHRAPIPPQDVTQVSTNWPAGNIEVRMAQLPGSGAAEVDDHGGHQRRRLSRIAVFQDHDRRHGSRAGRDGGRANSSSLPASPAAPEQLWRIEQLPDGTWRIMPKSVPNSKEPLALSAIGSSFPTLSKFDPGERQTALAVESAVRPSVMNLASKHFAARSRSSAADLRVAADHRAPPRAYPHASGLPRKPPDADGFIQRWLILEPIRCQRRSRTTPSRERSRRNTSRTNSPSFRATATR